jgi:hypothetical protein
MSKMIALLALLASSQVVEASVAGCPYWCDAQTCGQEMCAGCPACNPLSSGQHCAHWCNLYTCGFESIFGNLCGGCEICETLSAGAHCERWCNFYCAPDRHT